MLTFGALVATPPPSSTSIRNFSAVSMQFLCIFRAPYAPARQNLHGKARYRASRQETLDAHCSGGGARGPKRVGVSEPHSHERSPASQKSRASPRVWIRGRLVCWSVRYYTRNPTALSAPRALYAAGPACEAPSGDMRSNSAARAQLTHVMSAPGDQLRPGRRKRGDLGPLGAA